MLIAAMLMAAALGAPDPDTVVATAPETTVDLNVSAQPLAPSVTGVAQAAVPHGLSTDEQIDRWIESRAAGETAPWPEAGPESLDDRKMHGEVSVGVGTGGYRDYGVAMSLPLGETGWLSLEYRQTENGYPYGGYGYGYGDPYFGGDRAFGGYRRSGAAAEFEARGQRPKGPARDDR
jgi:hypothetical protein